MIRNLATFEKIEANSTVPNIYYMQISHTLFTITHYYDNKISSMLFRWKYVFYTTFYIFGTFLWLIEAGARFYEALTRFYVAQ